MVALLSLVLLRVTALQRRQALLLVDLAAARLNALPAVHVHGAEVVTERLFFDELEAVEGGHVIHPGLGVDPLTRDGVPAFFDEIRRRRSPLALVFI